MIIDLKTAGLKLAEDVTGHRRVLIQAKSASGNPTTAVLEVRRAFSSRLDSPSVPFASPQIVTLDGSAILEIETTDTAWLHFEVTTAQPGTSIEIAVEKSGEMKGYVYSETVDLSVAGKRSSVHAINKAFVLAVPQLPNTAAIEIKRSLDRSFDAISFPSAVNLTVDGSTIEEIDASTSTVLVVDCGTAQASQRADLHWYIRNETLDDVGA